MTFLSFSAPDSGKLFSGAAFHSVLQDHRDCKVENGAYDDAERHSCEKKSVEEGVALFFIAAGSEDQRAA